MKFYLSYQGHYHAIEPGRRYELGAQLASDFTLPLKQVYTLIASDKELVLEEQSYDLAGIYPVELEGITFKILALGHQSSYWLPDELVYLSKHPQASIQLEMMGEMTLHEEGNLYRVWSERPVTLNGRSMQGNFQAQIGDYLFVEDGHVLHLREHHVEIGSIKPIHSRLLPVEAENHERAQRAADYHRSPRIIRKEPENKVTLLAPPTEDEHSGQPIWRTVLMPLTMIGMTGLMYLLSAGRGMMFLMMGMSVVSIIMSVHQYFSEKKKFRDKQERKIVTYREYLDTKYQEIAKLAEEQRQARSYHYPAGSSLVTMARHVDRRIYEKGASAFDFLAYSLGLGDVKPSFDLKYQAAELSHYNRAVADEARALVDAYRTISQLPIPNSLSFGPVGYIGNRQVAIEQVQQALIQLATFHSYHDVQFIVVGPEEEQESWKWMRWLPHSYLSALNTKGFVFSQASRDRLMTSLYQIIKDRKLKVETQNDSKKGLLFLPQYILIVTDMSLLQDHLISEFIQEDLTELGVSLMIVENVMENLPDHVRTVLHCADWRKGELVLQNGEYIQQALQPYAAMSEREKGQFARYLSSIHHVLTMKNALPDSVSFLTMYGAQQVGDLQVSDRWQNHHAYQTLAVPIGYRGRDELLQLDLHEQAHGPHGLIAGTTGSGKSELIQTYILSLAVNYHPYEVAFLLIDYKGGGMANLFQHLPHVVGIITNLEAAQANRALVSIRAELLKRQRLFAEHGLNHINQYHKLRQQNSDLEPMPHLFLISDEFAELKAEQPDFMNELISIARVGRSLGVHLILATQKPSGVVNDQIWSNSRFKIALKVQDISDSREILHTPDAATLTQVGRAYLQVGNNEIYELFQSAWSGAPYQGAGDSQPRSDALTLYEIEETGQLRPINQDLSGLDYQETIESNLTELDVVVEDLATTFQASGEAKVAQPWLPPLEEMIHLPVPTVSQVIQRWEQADNRLKATIAIVDMPHEQKQDFLTLDLGISGHIAILGSPGFGRSTFLQVLALELMRHYSPDRVQFYLLDFGTGGLFPLREYPHVGDIISLDDETKATKWLNWMERTLAKRRELLTQSHVANVEQYNLLSGDKLPTLMILVDSLDGLTESKLKDHVDYIITKVAREGVALGIQLVITASRWYSIKLQIQSSIKTKIALYLFDQSEVTSSVGRSDLKLPAVPGRGLINLGTMAEFQVVTPFDTDDFATYSRLMREEGSSMTQLWQGALPYAIPMMPEHITPTYLNQHGMKPNKDLILGVNHETGEAVRLSIQKAMMLISDNPLIVENYLVALDYNLTEYYSNYSIAILDGVGIISEQLFTEARHINGQIAANNAVSGIVEDLKERIANPDKKHKSWFILFTDVVTLVNQGALSESDMRLILQSGPRLGVTPIFVGMDKNIVTSTSNQVKLLKQLVEQTIVGMRRNDQSLVRLPQYISMEPDLKNNQSFLLRGQEFELIQILERR
ncbi:type VII secretion protein EssC [Abiotrophia defectiva]